MRELAGTLLILVSLAGLAIGGLWAFMKAAGAEVDICRAGEGGCTSGWYYAVPILVAALVIGAIGIGLVRSRPERN
jgi:hypothetical protein